MKKEQWINEVFESTKNLERLEASPFLAEKVIDRIALSNEAGNQGALGIKWAFGLVAALFIVINIVSLAKAEHNKEAGRVEIQHAIEGINNQVIYNY